MFSFPIVHRRTPPTCEQLFVKEIIMCSTLLECLADYKPQEMLEAVFQTVTATSVLLELLDFVSQFLGLETINSH